MKKESHVVGAGLTTPQRIEQALDELGTFRHLFADTFAGHDEDGEWCLTVEFCFPYPGSLPSRPNGGSSWSATVYADRVEVWRPMENPANPSTHEMSIGAFVDLLNRIEWELGRRADILSNGKEAL